MTPKRIIAGRNANDIINQLNEDLAATGFHDYHITIQEEGHNIDLDIVSSPGGGFEGGYDQTMLTAELPSHSGFRFSIYPEDILTKVGKAFGMQDLKIGYPEFDEAVIVKSNDEQHVKQLFADEEVRKVFQTLSGFSLHIDAHKEKHGDHLHLLIQRAITSAAELQPILNAFYHVLTSLTGTGNVSTEVPVNN